MRQPCRVDCSGRRLVLAGRLFGMTRCWCQHIGAGPAHHGGHGPLSVDIRYPQFGAMAPVPAKPPTDIVVRLIHFVLLNMSTTLNLSAGCPEPNPNMQTTLQSRISGPLLTVAELAIYLKVAPVTVYRMTESRRLPVLRIGRRLRYRRDDVDRHLDSATKRDRYAGPAA